RVAALAQLGRAADRIAALELAARTFPDDARLARLLGLGLADAGREPEAIAALARALALDPSASPGAAGAGGGASPGAAGAGSGASPGAAGAGSGAADVALRLAGLHLEAAKREAAAGKIDRAIEAGRASLAVAADPTAAAIFVGDLL